MNQKLPDPLRCKKKVLFLLYVGSLIIVSGTFFLGLILVKNSKGLSNLNRSKTQATKKEVFGFAPYWTLDKLDNIDWQTLTTFAYFSLPVNSDGSIDKYSYEWQVFNGEKVGSLLKKAGDNNVKKVVTLTQMDAGTIETFLANPDAWERMAYESVSVINSRDLDGVNIDFEYIPSNNYLKKKFNEFVSSYSKILDENLSNPYVTVSVLASSVRFNRIYDIGYLAAATDGVFMMAYDFYYPGSESIGPSSPLYGYNDGKGPFWYDVSTAVSDFIKVADSRKIILGVPYYGWNYPAYSPKPNTNKVVGTRASVTTQEKIQNNRILSTTPVAGWDDSAKVSWRAYFDNNGWQVVYMEDNNSLSYKYDLINNQNLGGVGIWALGYDAGDSTFWSLLKKKFSIKQLAYLPL